MVQLQIKYFVKFSSYAYSETVHAVVENERLKNNMADLKQQNERTAEVRPEAQLETDGR